MPNPRRAALRSFIDSRIEAMQALCDRHCFKLPPFARWNEARYRAEAASARRIREAGLGWNVVEFKPGAFRQRWLALFTLRMGDWRGLATGSGRLYAEKAMMAEEGQGTPHHFHIVETEDILNRGGARFFVELFKVDAAGAQRDERFYIQKDAQTLDLTPGARVSLEPRESLTLEPFLSPIPSGPRAAMCWQGEMVNDDATDNYFLPPLEPFAAIEEDAPMRYVTSRDHARLAQAAL